MDAYLVLHKIEGFRDKVLTTGEKILDATEEEAVHIKDLLEQKAIRLIHAIEGKSDETPIDLNSLSESELIAQAKDKYGEDLDPTLSKEALIAELVSLEANTQDIDAGTEGSDDLATMKKADLVALAQSKYGYTLNSRLGQPAMVAEIKALQAKAPTA